MVFKGHENIVLGLYNPQKVSSVSQNVTVGKVQVGLEIGV